MNTQLSPGTQAILLLTGPLIIGKHAESADLLSQSEFNKLARILRDRGLLIPELLGPDAERIVDQNLAELNSSRLKRLLARGFLLSEAVERWSSRAIWIVSRLDTEYPTRLKLRLKGAAPPVLYGCGEVGILEGGGLAVVGSRNANADVLSYTEFVGSLAGKSGKTIISGGARGVDSAAMCGAQSAGGQVVGVLAEMLGSAAISPNYRDGLMQKRTVLVSAYDPSAGFNVGHALQRNKLIYALADAALVMESDYQKGGTWAGAIEQLERLKFVPVFVPSEKSSKGIQELANRGAQIWPASIDTALLNQLLDASHLKQSEGFGQPSLPFDSDEKVISSDARGQSLHDRQTRPNPADALLDHIRTSLSRELSTPATVAEVASMLRVTTRQAEDWVHLLVKDGVLVQTDNSMQFRAAQPIGGHF